VFAHIWRMRGKKKKTEDYEKFGRQVTLATLKKIDGCLDGFFLKVFDARKPEYIWVVLWRDQEALEAARSNPAWREQIKKFEAGRFYKTIPIEWVCESLCSIQEVVAEKPKKAEKSEKAEGGGGGGRSRAPQRRKESFYASDLLMGDSGRAAIRASIIHRMGARLCRPEPFACRPERSEGPRRFFALRKFRRSCELKCLRSALESADFPSQRAWMKSYYVYIMASRSRTLYTGVTSNLERRVLAHKRKLIPGFTREYNINRLVHFESFEDVRIAIHREKQIKGWLRAKKVALIIAHNPAWKDLSKCCGIQI